LNQGRDMAVYRQYLKDQVRALLTNYGKDRHHVAGFLPFPGKRQGQGGLGFGESAERCASCKPGIIVNDRLTCWTWRAAGTSVQPEQFQAARMGDDERPCGALGDLSDILRVLGILPATEANLEGTQARSCC